MRANLLLMLWVTFLCACQKPEMSEMKPEPVRWKAHDMSRPQPQAISPVHPNFAPPPAGAVVLFDGTDLSSWESNGEAARWNVQDGYFEVAPGTGAIRTKDGFGDVHLHIEWEAPSPPRGEGQNRGNSGVFLMRRYEIQVLDSYNADTYADGQAGAIYGQYPPRFNASLPPGEWQSYDIFFRRPGFDEEGGLLEAARVTVIHNGILIQDNQELWGGTAWLKYSTYEKHSNSEPIELQDHGSPVRFRNVWALRLPDLMAPDSSYAMIDTFEMTVQQLDRYMGVYNRPNTQATITLSREGTRVFGDFYHRAGLLELTPVSATEFIMNETAGRLVFELDENQAPVSLVWQMGGAEMPATKAREGEM